MTKNKFFGRKNHLDLLDKRINGFIQGYRQNIAIIGDELVGKTSLISCLLNKFYDNRIITIYLEVRHETLESFANRFAGVMLYNFLGNSAIPLKEDIDFLLLKAQNFIPKTCDKIRQILTLLKRRKKNAIFTELLTLCDIINQETGKFCLVIFDEFHNLERLNGINLYKEWPKLLISQKTTMYIIASSMSSKTKTILSKNLSLLFGNFELINVEPFDIKTSAEYLEDKLHGLQIKNTVKDFIVHFTGGYPFYLEVISDEFNKTEGASLIDILENLLFNSSGILNQKFLSYIKRFLDSANTSDYVSILYLIASGRNKIKDIAQISHKPQKEIMARLNRLIELDVITRSADFLKINDRVFGFWLKFVYQEKLHSLTFDAANQQKEFRGKINTMIEEFLAHMQKPLTERMAELLRLFEDEVMQLDRSKIRLNHLREIKPLEFSAKRLKYGLIGRSTTSLWILAFKQELLTEDDITEFEKECKKYRHKVQRKVIITLGDIDINTRLRAMEKKILAWDINTVNKIFDFYSKPWVIA